MFEKEPKKQVPEQEGKAQKLRDEFIHITESRQMTPEEKKEGHDLIFDEIRMLHKIAQEERMKEDESKKLNEAA